MSNPNELCYLAGLCTCGGHDETTQIDKPGASPILGAMMNPTDSPLAHIPGYLSSAIDKAMTAAFRAGQLDHKSVGHPEADDALERAARLEAEMWEALADYCMTHGWRV